MRHWSIDDSSDTFMLHHRNGELIRNVFCQTKFFVRNTRYNAFVIVTPGFSKSEGDIGNNILGISSDIMVISNRKYRYTRYINPLSASFTKWSNTLKQFVDKLLTNCLSVFDHFVGLALKCTLMQI